MMNRIRMLSKQLVGIALFSMFSFSVAQAGVTLGAGNGYGLPGWSHREVTITLDNPSDRVNALQVDICDDDNYLVLTGCETTARTDGFTCATNELSSGCARVILYSTDESNTLIAEGTGPVVSLKYQVSGEAPEGECRILELEGAKVSDYENRSLEVLTLSGQFCFTGTAPITTTSTTTIIPVTTTIPDTTTTTTAIPTCKVTVSPKEATIDSGTTLQFTARTACGGEEVAGSYFWEIVPASTIGSAVTQSGLFTAGENVSGTNIQETVKVTDTAHENTSATATVTVKRKEEPPPECQVRINPSVATVTSGESLTLSASTIGDAGCNPGAYEWSITSPIGSSINQEGYYTAGSNTTGAQVTDTVTVVDRANLNISGTAMILVEPEEEPATSLRVFPGVLLGSRWIPLFYLLIITSEDAVFNLNSTLSFVPGNDVTPLLQVGFGTIFFALVILDANPQEGVVTVNITTDGGIARGEMEILLLPFILGEGGVTS